MILFTIELDALLPKKVALHFLHVFFMIFYVLILSKSVPITSY